MRGTRQTTVECLMLPREKGWSHGWTNFYRGQSVSMVTVKKYKHIYIVRLSYSKGKEETGTSKTFI